MNAQFQEELNRLLPNQKSKILVAVSGGVDSMVLLDLLTKTNHQLAVAHCNYQLRSESDEETKLVKRTSLLHSIPFHSVDFDTKEEVENSTDSLQMVARNLRYEFFRGLCEEHKYEFIATAHHADDNLESMLLNFTKGTGIRGMIGISPKNGNVLRPLLPFTKQELTDFAKENKIEFLEDKSNLESNYQRNFLRNEVIPLLKTINPQLSKTSINTNQNLGFAFHSFEGQLKRLKNKLLNQDGNQFILYKKQLVNQAYPDRLFYEILSDYNFQGHQIETLFELISRNETKPSKIYESISHLACIDNKGRLLISPNGEITPTLIQQDDSSVQIGEQKITLIQLEKQPVEFRKDETTILVDSSLLEFPLQIRKWTAGDYFYPIGLGKKKKVARYLIDEKVNKIDKENQMVITSGQKIIWVVGKRMDDRFKITKTTKQILQMSI